MTRDAGKSAYLQARVKPSLIIYMDEFRDLSRDGAGDRPSRSDVVRLALKDFLGRELARLRVAQMRGGKR